MNDLRALINELCSLQPESDFVLALVNGSAAHHRWQVDFWDNASLLTAEVGHGDYKGEGDTPERAVLSCIDDVRSRLK